jgi:hypothetical protein
LKKVNELVLCSEDYSNENEFRNKIVEAIMLLTGAGYICVVREDEIGIIAIEFERSDRSYGSPYPYWLTPEQAESIPSEYCKAIISLETHYNADVWTDTETDTIRKERCLCLKCKKCTRVNETNCPTAQKLFEIAQNDSCAMMMTRCKNFEHI